jgi:SAM-dependent methyltransferase
MNPERALPEDFIETIRKLEESYLEESDPIRQSGFGGGAQRWQAERGLILEAVDADGDFLDIGCANGYLLKCLVGWGKDRGINLIPFGLDIGSRLIELARLRFPDRPDHFWVGNAWNWLPPRRFRYVYTLTDLVPPDYLKAYLQRLLDLFVARKGRLIAGAYGSISKRQPARDVSGWLETLGFTVAGSATCGDLPVSHIAWITTD